jgi:hypothetical protein
MTTTLAPVQVRRPGAGTVAVALLLPVGPAAIAVLRLLLPYYTASDTEGMVTAVGAEPDRQSAVIWLAYIGILTLVPGLIAATQVCRDAAPRLTAWALALGVPGYLSLGMFVGADHLLWSTSAAGLSPGDSAAVVEAGHLAIDVSLGVFVVGHVVGTVLLGLAMLRSGRIPAWAAWALTISQPLHFVATVVIGSPVLDFVAWGLTAVGMALVGRAYVELARR